MSFTRSEPRRNEAPNQRRTLVPTGTHKKCPPPCEEPSLIGCPPIRTERIGTAHARRRPRRREAPSQRQPLVRTGTYKKRPSASRRAFSDMVPKAGLEPAQLAPLPPQDSVSTNSTTWA